MEAGERGGGLRTQGASWEALQGAACRSRSYWTTSGSNKGNCCLAEKWPRPGPGINEQNKYRDRHKMARRAVNNRQGEMQSATESEAEAEGGKGGHLFSSSCYSLLILELLSSARHTPGTHTVPGLD